MTSLTINNPSGVSGPPLSAEARGQGDQATQTNKQLLYKYIIYIYIYVHIQ